MRQPFSNRPAAQVKLLFAGRRSAEGGWFLLFRNSRPNGLCSSRICSRNRLEIRPEKGLKGLLGGAKSPQNDAKFEASFFPPLYFQKHSHFVRRQKGFLIGLRDELAGI